MLRNFGRMTTSTIQFESRDQILLVTSYTETMTSKPLFQNIFILRKPAVANFADIIRVISIFINTTFKYSKKKINK